MTRFIHTSDIHLGRRFGRYPEALRNRLTEARQTALSRIADAARAHQAEFILVAGDLFDTATPSPRTIAHALEILNEDQALTWVIIPGNHDPFSSDELWTRVRASAGPNIHIASEPAPLNIGSATILPAPLLSKNTALDLTAWMDTCDTSADRTRIGLAHGAIVDFGDGEGQGIIDPVRATSARLDYLALGDWHGQRQVKPRTWYSGTPEPDRFRHDAPGQVLAVTVDAPGAQAQVTPVETGAFLWRDMALDIVPGMAPADTLRTRLPEGTRRQTLLRLAVTGRSDLAGKLALSDIVREVTPEFAWVDFDDTGLAVEYDAADLDGIDLAGALREAASELLAEASDTALSEADRKVAGAALTRLYSIAGSL
ncbi:metallophosphoesterase family protein [Amaricoccus tamworthensis]|uniref:metallophosphoesterase family protein n=1 Tax=Amaricoccus tamworthensis TaxID=57002 RepID=UPI003C7A0D5B